MKDLRQEYGRHALSRSEMARSPFVQFQTWFEEAHSSGIMEPNACILSTRTERGVDSRTILLKGLDDERFVFYTNYLSNKGRQLEAAPECSLCFLWLGMERQVVVRGRAYKVSEDESNAYFSSRPRGSQVGAWVSAQSKPIDSRTELENKLSEQEARFEGRDVSRPEHWGGFGIDAYEIEFWQGRPNRLHDRILYRKAQDVWEIVRLQP